MRKEVVTLISDLSQDDADETVQFEFNGQAYEIDLTDAEARRLRMTLAPYADAARPLGGERRSIVRPPLIRRTVAPAPGTKAERDRIRDWARANGYEIKGSVRIPSEIVEAYHSAH